MEKNEKEVQAGIHLKGMAAHILKEVIKADMSMHQAQTEAWKMFGEYRPWGDLVNRDIHLGFADQRYLCLNEVKLTFHIKPVPLSFFSRVKLATKLLFGFSSLILYKPTAFDLCTASDKNSMAMTMVVKRFENGTVQAEYKPVDTVTTELLQEI